MNKIKILELFGGIGSPRKALENLGIDIKLIDYVEILDYAVVAYNKMYCNDKTTQDIKEWNLNVDILIHGSPCQDFSVAGKNDLESGRSILYMRTLEIIEKELTKKPQVVIWENVKGLINKNNIQHYNHYLKWMEKMGYKNQYRVLNSKDFGIPQSRDRVFTVSIHKDSKLTFDFNNIKPIELVNNLESFLEKEVPINYYIKQKSMIKAVESGKIKMVNNVCNTITTKQWRWNNAGVVCIPLTTFNSENYVIDIKNSKSVTKTITATGALSRQKIAIEAIKPLEGIPVFMIDNKPYHLRILTEKECWRLMGFDNKTIEKVFDKTAPIPKTMLYSLAGNSIVVQVMEAIFRELLKVK